VTVALHDESSAGAVAAVQQAGLPINAVLARRPTLDDVYLRLTNRKETP